MVSRFIHTAISSLSPVFLSLYFLAFSLPDRLVVIRYIMEAEAGMSRSLVSYTVGMTTLILLHGFYKPSLLKVASAADRIRVV